MGDFIVEVEMGESLSEMDYVEEGMRGGVSEGIVFFFGMLLLVMKMDVGFDYVFGYGFRNGGMVCLCLGNV